MEGHLHHPIGAIQTKHHVLWNVQLTGYLPGIHGQSFQQLYHGRLVDNLYGRSTNPFLETGIT